LRHLRQVAQEYPGLWPQIDQMRTQRGRHLPLWPPYCFLPLAGAVAIVTGGARAPQPAPLLGPQISRVGALAAWRATQGLYRFDPDVFEALWSTPLEGALPTRLVHHLPEWCVYILCPTPRPVLGALSTLYGYYAHLEWDVTTHAEDLRLLLDLETATGAELLPQALPLGEWDLGVAAQRALTTSLG